MTTTMNESDIHILAWSFGRRVENMGHAYRLLEAGQADAVRVFDALSRDEWGVKAAFADGLRGVDITARDPKNPTIVHAWTGGAKYPEPLRRTTRVAANGGTI